MLKRLHLKNFTVFADADFEFGPGLNVLVGTNGIGKTHLLKLGYAMARAAASFKVLPDFKLAWDRNNILSHFQGNMRRVFLPDYNNVGRLVRWQAKENSVVAADFNEEFLFGFQFEIEKTDDPNQAVRLNEFSEKYDAGFAAPVFIPAKEILTLSWIPRMEERYRLPVDGTYLELFALLRLLPLKQIEPASVAALANLEATIGGTVEQLGDAFYFVLKEGRKVEANLIAEGIRKFGTLFLLLANGSLTKQTTLFWDEPEANLNPKLLRQLAAILAELARQGFQIILATHSMSLLKEFHILSREKEKGALPIRYFGLNARAGHATTVIAKDDFEYLPDVVALEVELEQADKLDEIFAREDREFHANNH